MGLKRKMVKMRKGRIWEGNIEGKWIKYIIIISIKHSNV
jgi:hypothetical protein